MFGLLKNSYQAIKNMFKVAYIKVRNFFFGVPVTPVVVPPVVVPQEQEQTLLSNLSSDDARAKRLNKFPEQNEPMNFAKKQELENIRKNAQADRDAKANRAIILNRENKAKQEKRVAEEERKRLEKKASTSIKKSTGPS